MISLPATIAIVALSITMSLQPAASKACEGEKPYHFRVFNQWTEKREGGELPRTAKFSHMLGVAHTASYTLWAEGKKASPAVVDLLRLNGASTIFRKEETGRGDHKIIGGALEAIDSVLYFNLSLSATKGETWVSIVGGIQPSPGWMYGREKFNLCDEKKGKWLKEKDDGANGWRLYGYNSGLSAGDAYADEFVLKEMPDVIKPLAKRHFAYAEMRMAQKEKDLGEATGDGDKLRDDEKIEGSRSGGKRGLLIGGSVAGALALLVILAGLLFLWNRNKMAEAEFRSNLGDPNQDQSQAEGGDVQW